MQLLNSEINPDPRTWSDNTNATIEAPKNDPFEGRDGYNVTDTNDQTGPTLKQTLQINGIYTISCFVRGDQEVLIGKDLNNSINFDLSTGKVTSVTGSVIAYDVLKVGLWYKVSVVVTLIAGQISFRITGTEGVSPEFFRFFNPTVIKGNLLNFTPSEVLLQSNTQVFSHTSIRLLCMVDRKESVAYNLDTTLADRYLRAFFIAIHWLILLFLV